MIFTLKLGYKITGSYWETGSCFYTVTEISDFFDIYFSK